MIHLIITTANIPQYFEKRKKQYIESIEACLKFSNLFDSYTILECFSNKLDYLTNYNVFYSGICNPFPNKGLNEMRHLKAFLNQSHFTESDAIIKLTGRYLVEDGYFFEKVYEYHEQ